MKRRAEKLGYSARRLLTHVRVNGSPVAQFFYDACGRRAKIVEGNTATITLLSGIDIVGEVKTQPYCGFWSNRPPIRRVTNHPVPLGNGQLAGDHGRACLRPVVDHL